MTISRPVVTAPANPLWLNAKDFGATGNNSTDDTAAINAAIAAAAAYASGAGAVVYLPPGNYVHTGLLMKSKVELRGAGHAATQLKLAAGANNHCIQLDTARVEMISIRDLRIFGNRTNQTGTWHGIYLVNDAVTNGAFGTGFNNPHHFIDNVIIDKCSGDGLNLAGDAFGGECHISNVFSYSNGRYGFTTTTPDCFWDRCSAGSNGEYGFYLAGGANSRFVNCKAWFSGQITSANGHGFYLTGSGARRLQLIGCEAQDNVQNGFVLDGAQMCLVSGCTADSNGTGNPGAGYGFALINGSTLNHVSGITYDRNGSPVQGYGLRLDSNVSGNLVDLVIGPVATTGISGNLGNNRVRVVRGTGSAREQLFSNLEITGGGLKLPVTFNSASTYTVAASDAIVINTVSGSTVTLPTAVGISGRLYTIKNAAGASMTVASAGGNIDSSSTATLTANSAARYVSDNTQWWSA